MHKVDAPGATAGHEFTDGGEGIARTIVASKWMNAVQRELVGVVEQAGIALSDTDDGQLKRSVILHVRNVTALRAMPVPSLPSGTVFVVTAGSSDYADGGGRLYYWSASSSAADNGSSVIRPSTLPATGRWLSVQLALAAITGGAPLDSPAFTGTPTAPTQAVGNNSTRLATTAFVSAAIAALVDSSPSALDTLNELAAALGDDANFATTVTNALALKAPLASPALTGTPTAPTASTATNNTQIATTAYVKAVVAALVNSSPASLDTLQELAAALGNDANFATTVTNALAAKAPLSSPALTGTPTAPTAGAGTNTTQIASTAFVQAAVAAGAPSEGSYSPMVTSISNVTSGSGTVYWAKVAAKTYILWGELSIVSTSGLVQWRIDLPAGINLTSSAQLAGMGSQISAVSPEQCAVTGDAANDAAIFKPRSSPPAGTNTFNFHATVRVP